MSFNPLYNEYTPTKIVIDNLGINITADRNDGLALSSEYLVVGEKNDGNLSMIVDSRGICINTRGRTSTQFDNEIHGTTLLKGNIHVDGAIFGRMDGSVTQFGSIFNYSSNGGIYYDGRTTFGTSNSSLINEYVVNISKPIQRNIDNAQFAIQNNRNAVGKIAIIGESEFSPFIFNTSSNVPIEFHVGRNRAFFENAYRSTDSRRRDPNELVPSDTPTYLGKTVSPHLNIDINGNVGIKTDINRLFRYNIRTLDVNGSIQYETQVFHPDLFVNGTTFSSNILMFDYETDTHKNLDELYARRSGQSIVLSNLAPGTFAPGFFKFQSNISIGGDIVPSAMLMVHGDTSNTGNIHVNGNLKSEKTLTTRTIHVEEKATFSNNLYIQDNLFVKANIYKYVSTVGSEDRYEMLSISSNVLNLQNGAASDFFSYMSGYATGGRLGVGIDPSRSGQVNNQFVVKKRDRTIFELELTDNNYEGFIKTAFIGHAKSDYDNRNDGSLVFVTPSPDNETYHKSQRNAQQNIYFYPGYERALSTFDINSNNPPTLGMFVNKKVGINMFNPQYDLDVNGDIGVTGNYYIKRSNNTSVKMGIWNDGTFGIDNRYTGIFYYNEASPRVGINTIPKENYGLTVVGKILSTDGFYTIDGLKTVPFYNSYQALSNTELPYEYAYLRGSLGIGDLGSIGTLTVRDSFPGLNTTVKLLNSAEGQHSSLHFVGNAHEYIQIMDDTDGTFEIFNGSSNIMMNKTLSRALITKKYPSGLNQVIINSNIGYGIRKSNAALVVNGNVDIVGDMNITGDYRISGRAIEITAGEPAEFYKTPNTQDNVYVTGENIHLNPNSLNNGGLYIGWRDSLRPGDQDALVNIALQTVGNTRLAYIAKFTSLNNTTALSQYICNSGYSPVIGINRDRFFIGGGTTEPYITVDPQNNNSVGIGTSITNGSRLHVYSQINGQPLATFTRYNGTSDSTDIFSGISLEKKINSASYKWNIHAPVLDMINQKLQFLYQDNVNVGYSVLTEKVCITNKGFIGINSPDPKYALDINGIAEAGSIRMRQSQQVSSRQNLVFQSGNDTYGGDLLTDYSICAFSNSFSIESADAFKGIQTILNIGSNNTIGLKQIADDRYAVSINGKLNVNDAIYVRDRPVFSVLDNNNDNGSFLEWRNIFINPDPFVYGGVSINSVKMSSNVFQVNSGSNGNVAVLNSTYPQSLIHFRNLHINEDVEEDERIWRAGSSNNSFIIEYRSNVLYGETLITDSVENYARVSEYIQSTNVGEFIERLNGSIELDAVSPSIMMNHVNIFGLSNENMYITTSNFGVGTSSPLSKFHIENNDDVESLKIVHNNTSCNIVAINRDNFVITHRGDVGIGTSVPSAKIHIVGTTKFENTDSIAIEVVGDSIFQNNITIKGNVVNDSDYRIKSDVKVIENALSKIKKISGYTFIKNGVSPRETGVIAQEIKEVLPEAVFEHKDGLLGVAYGNVIGLLIEGIKELSDKIDNLHLKKDSDY